jgi:hypothetical protein
MTAAGEAHTRWSAELDTRRAELDALRRRVGDVLLDDPAAGDLLAEQEARLVVAVRQAEQAVSAAGVRVPPLRRRVLAARAAELQGRADALAAAATKRQARTDALLAELQEWEGDCRYVPWVPTAAQAEAGRDVLPGLPGLSGARYKLPATEIVRRDADRLRRQAVRLAQLAESGSDDEVGRELVRPVPEPSAVERTHVGV